MADEKKQILLNIKIDEGQAKERLKEITSLLAGQTKAQRELAAEVRKAGSATDEQAAQLVEYKASISSLTREQSALYKNLALYEKVQKSTAGSYDELSAAAIAYKLNLNKLEGTLQANADGTFELSQEYLAAKTASENANKALNEFDLGVNKGGRNVGLYANSIAGLEEQLKDLNAALRVADANSPEFEETQKAADETKFKLMQLTGAVDEFGNREPKNKAAAEMDALSDATGGAVSALELYNLAASESEGAAAAQAAALRAIAVAQNLRNLQLGLANAGEAASVIISKASTLATNAKTKAVGLATVATRVWNTVLRLNPIGLVITGVLAAVAAVTFLTNKFNLAAKAGAFFNEHFSGVVKWLQKTGEALGLVDSATEKALATMAKRKEAAAEEIRVLEASEGKEREVYLKRRQLMFDEIRLLNKLHKEKGKLSDEQVTQRRTLLNDMKILDIEEQTRLKKEGEDSEKAAKDKSKKALEAAKKELEEALRRRKELLEISKGYIELDLDQAEDGTIRQLELRQKLIRKQLEIDNTGADISRERRVLNEKKASAELLKVREEYFKKMEVQYRDLITNKIGAITDADVQKQMEATAKMLADKEDATNRRAAMAENEAAQSKEFIEGINAVFQASLTEQGFSLQKFTQGVLMVVLDTLEKQMIASSTAAVMNATVGSMTTPDSIATAGASGLVRAAVMAALIKGAFAVAKAGLTQILSSGSPAEFYNGGFTTKGNPREQATNLGSRPYVYHKSEYVAPHDVLADPAGAYHVNQLEGIRLRKRGLADGGFAPAYNYNTLPPVPAPYDHFAAAARYSISNGGSGAPIDYRALAQELSKVQIVTKVSDVKAGLNKAEMKHSKANITTNPF